MPQRIACREVTHQVPPTSSLVHWVQADQPVRSPPNKAHLQSPHLCLRCKWPCLCLSLEDSLHEADACHKLSLHNLGKGKWVTDQTVTVRNRTPTQLSLCKNRALSCSRRPLASHLTSLRPSFITFGDENDPFIPQGHGDVPIVSYPVPTALELLLMGMARVSLKAALGRDCGQRHAKWSMSQ